MIEYSSLWWNVRPDSVLNEFLEDFLEHKPVFILDDLISAFKCKAYENNMIEKGNSSIIGLSGQLQAGFNASVINIDDLPGLLIDHVYVLDKKECLELQQHYIAENFSVYFKDNFIYDDPLSLFYVHPTFNFIVNQNQKTTYTWNELYDLFCTFCTKNSEHFTHCDNFHLRVNQSSPLSKYLNFKIFHFNQIGDILEQIVTYVGKAKTLEKSCAKLKHLYTLPAFEFLTYLISMYSGMLPNTLKSVNL